MQTHSTLPDTAIKTCIRCGETKPTTEFFSNPRSKSGLRGHCKACHNKTRKPDRRWQIVVISLRNRHGSAPRIRELREALGEPSSCYLCGGPLSWEAAALDHVIPVSRSGTGDPSNLRWTHRDCNKVKAHLTLEELVDVARRIVDVHGGVK